MKRVPAWMTSVALCAIGAVGLSFKSACWKWFDWSPILFRELLPAAGEAFIVAGVLALFVDPFLKEKLLKEASKDIFEHIIGFDHEPQLKAEIRRIAFETKLYQKDYNLACTVEPNSDGSVRLTFSKEVEVVNESLDIEKFHPGWRFTESDSPNDCKIEQIIDGNDSAVMNANFVADGSGYLSAYAPEVEIRPKRDGTRYRFISKCSAIQPQDWYHPIYFGLPTIDVRISVAAPDGWSVWIGGKEPQVATAVFHSSGLYMTGGKLEIHWRKPGQTLNTPVNR